MSDLFDGLLRLGDSALILGHRVSEWCGHGPYLEEDIALANTALDLIGQATLWLEYAAEVEGSEVQGKARSADDLAFLRDTHEYRNLLLVERPNGDFGQTIMRQFLFDAFWSLALEQLSASDDARVSEIAQKAAKETAYHLERSTDLCVRLGDGTEESHRRMQAALDDLWPYTGEMFLSDSSDTAVGLDVAALRAPWLRTVGQLETAGTLTLPDSAFAQRGGKTGQHSEHLGYLLAEMQWLPRTNPGATW